MECERDASNFFTERTMTARAPLNFYARNCRIASHCDAVWSNWFSTVLQFCWDIIKLPITLI